MEKKFESFCARVRREREGMPVRSKYEDGIVEESLRWASLLPLAEVATGLGISIACLQRWRRLREDRAVPSSTLVPELEPTTPVLNVTRITLQSKGEGQEARRVLARLVRGDVVVEFLDEEALARTLARVLS